MGDNAVHMLSALARQVLADVAVSGREAIGKSEETFGIGACIMWRDVIRREILENAGWMARLSSVLLEGGSNGAVVRINAPTRQGREFLVYSALDQQV